MLLSLRGAGLMNSLLTANGSFDDLAHWDGTAGAIEGDRTYLSQDFSSAGADLESCLKRYYEAHDTNATAHSIFCASTVWALAECIRRSTSLKREEIRNLLSSLGYTDTLGANITLKNPPHGDNLTPAVSVVKISGRGAYHLVS